MAARREAGAAFAEDGREGRRPVREMDLAGAAELTQIGGCGDKWKFICAFRSLLDGFYCGRGFWTGDRWAD